MLTDNDFLNDCKSDNVQLERVKRNNKIALLLGIFFLGITAILVVLCFGAYEKNEQLKGREQELMQEVQELQKEADSIE